MLITSTAKNLDALAQVVDLLDRAGSAEAADVNFVVLLNADASTAAQTLATIFSQGSRLGSRLGGTPGNAQPEAGSGRALVSPLNVTADRRINAIILSGRRDSIELAQRLLRDIDKPWDASVTEVKLFRLIHATPSRILPLLEAVFKEGTPVPLKASALLFLAFKPGATAVRLSLPNKPRCAPLSLFKRMMPPQL